MRSTMARGVAAAVVGLVAAACFAACSDDNSGSTPDSTPIASTGPSTTGAPIAAGDAPLRVEDIGPAVAAVEAALGGPQQYFEINATPTLVNLFVATEGATNAVAYVDAAGELQDPAAPQPASGPTFDAAQMDFDVERVLANVVAQLPDSTFRGFSAVGTEAGGVSYLVTVDSSQGARLEISVSGDGTILSVDSP